MRLTRGDSVAPPHGGGLAANALTRRRRYRDEDLSMDVSEVVFIAAVKWPSPRATHKIG